VRRNRKGHFCYAEAVSVSDTVPVFSSRTPHDLALNPLARALAAERARGLEILDLTETNPTRVGLRQPESLLRSLADPASLAYDPHPLGHVSARDAIACDYARRGRTVDPASVLVTASTSEAYGFLFKLLCDAGDEVAVPQPSYPLFEHLARLESVNAVPYLLESSDGAWAIDRASLRRAVGPRTRAVLVVSPNNPTGSMLTADDLAALVECAASADAALIGDEVFADYVLRPSRRKTASVLDQDHVLAFALGGLSKSVGLPQLKMAWTAVAGPEAVVREAIERLSFVGDTVLSVGTPVQRAAHALLEDGAALRRSIHDRLERNLSALEQTCAETRVATLLPVEGGWSAVLRLPEHADEEALVLDLLRRGSVLVHPGYFFDFAEGAHLVISLLPMPDVFDRAVACLCERIERR